MRHVVVHVALTLAGLAGVVWALTLGASPIIMCRDVVMQPGDVCANATQTKTQTYEERFATAQNARPVVGGVGLAVAAFGGVLTWAEVRRRADVTRPA